MMVETVTVKVQLALSGPNMTEDRALIYARGYVRLTEQPIPAAFAAALRQGFPKGYFEAEWQKGGTWDLKQRVEDQDW